MPRPPTFALQTAPAPGPVLDELEKFFAYWLGPPRPGYGEPGSALRGRALPEPLRRLYAFAGRWHCPDPETGLPTWVLNAGEGFRPLEQLEYDGRGTLYFADECQGNWSCATKARGADPPVWAKDNCGMAFFRWRRVERSLSRFLVTQSLRVLLAGSRLMAFDDDLARWFRAAGPEAVPLWTRAKFPYYPRGVSFYLLRGCVLVGDFDQDGVACAANHDEGVRLLEERQSPIHLIQLTPAGENLYHSLTIRRDGSAQFYVGNRAVDTPPGTIDFAPARDRLLATPSAPPGAPAAWSVAFLRTGQYGQRARAMTDPALARALLLRALDAVASDNPDVEAKRRRLLGSS